ncbi:aminoacyl-tRNA hydrolase [Crassaminicella profunda]|uniref:aminoacyl-tRNA hydrolase n=1 Tax=Crassaminicella profunda TaxID=1286698 RepID=UPI001CA60F25|nr:aminoacyl-tRNA hydrolase [Crassaminicella profunda]QZY54740.1 aminoacyl-tRNA hydrolase [Crassaminicella profunda]
MLVVVGLGNPGKQYEGTRHNVGFDTIDYLAYKNNISLNKVKYKAVVGEGFIHNQKVLLVKPQTYMNLSGRSVREIVNFYKLDMDDLIVIYDDIDTDVGKLRIRKKGSAGTHNGMKSIIYEIQSDGFARVRIGIGKPQYGNLADFVLGKFSKEDKDFMNESIKRAAESIESLISEGIEKAMNRYNG